MNHFKAILLLSAILFCTSLSAGADGTWTNFTNTNHITDIDFQGPYVWCATAGGVVRWDTRDMSCRVFGPEDGLPDYSATAIAVSGDGSVFAGTKKDVARFDGSRWSRIPLLEKDKDFRRINAVASAPDGTVWAAYWANPVCRWKNGAWEHFSDMGGEGITFAADGTVWIGQHDGLLKYDGTAWSKYLLEPSEENTTGDPAIDSEGNIWLAKPKKLYRFDGNAWKVFSLPDKWTSIHRLEFDQNGVLWFGTDHGVYRLEDDFFSPFTVSDGLPDELVSALRIAPDGTVWAGTARGLARYDGERWTAFHTDCLLPGDGNNKILIAPDGALWAATNNGIARYSNGKWTVYTEKDGLIKNWMLSISLAQDGSIWAGSFGGVSRFDSGKWTSFPMDDGSFKYVNSTYKPLIAPDGSVWIDTPTGIQIYRNGEWTIITPEDGLPLNVEAMEVDRDGVAWFGSPAGVTRYDGNTWRLYTVTDVLPGNSITWLLADMEGNIWAQNYEGIARFQDDKWVAFPSKDLFENKYSGVAYAGPDGSVWISNHISLYRYMNGTLTRIAHREEFPYLQPSQMKYAPDGSLWFGTFYGVMHWNGTTLTEYTPADGLAGIGVNSIDFSADGAVWIGTDRGVSRFMPNMVVAVRQKEESPAPFSILGNHPNPFNPSTTISFSLSAPEHVSLAVYDITGRKVRTLVSGPMSAGAHSVVWNGRDSTGNAVASGPYFSRLSINSRVETRKMLLMR